MTAWLQLLGACVARTLGGAALGLAGPGVSAADKESPGPLDTCEPRYSRTTGPGAAVRLERHRMPLLVRRWCFLAPGPQF